MDELPVPTVLGRTASENEAVGPRGCCGGDGVLSTVEAAKSLAPAMRALADGHRLAILSLLAGEAQTVVELTKTLGISQTLVSHHLKALREIGMVTVAAEGRSNRYSLCCAAMAQPVQFLRAIASSDGSASSDRGVDDVDARR